MFQFANFRPEKLKKTITTTRGFGPNCLAEKYRFFVFYGILEKNTAWLCALVTFTSNISSLSEHEIFIIGVATDYGHTKAKSLILCSPNSNPNPK